MNEKSTKSLFLPEFIIKILDHEAIKGGGPGIVAAASILEFSTKKSREKAEIIKRFHNKEVTISYLESEAVSELPSSVSGVEKRLSEIDAEVAGHTKSQKGGKHKTG